MQHDDGMRPFRRRPEAVRAFQYGIDPLPGWVEQRRPAPAGSALVLEGGLLSLLTVNGRAEAQRGMWIVRDGRGRTSLWVPDEFEATFEPIGGGEASDAA